MSSLFRIILSASLWSVVLLSAFAAEIRYTLESPASVSLAVYEKNGRMVRELLRGDKQSAGEHVISWDGLDREGNAMPTGEYVWKIAASEGLKAEYLLSLGTSVGHHHWPGVHGGASAVTVDGDTMFMAGAGSETQVGIAASKLDGTFLWSVESPGGWGTCSAMSVMKNELWMQFADGLTCLVHAEDGEGKRVLGSSSVPVPGMELGDKVPQISAEDALETGWLPNVQVSATDSGHLIKSAEGERGAFLRLMVPPALSMSTAVTYRVKVEVLRGGESGGPDIVIGAGRKELGKSGSSLPFKGTFTASKSEKNTITFDVEGNDDGRLDILFFAQNKKAFEFVLSSISVTAMANRMDVAETGIYVAASSQDRILRLDPNTAIDATAKAAVVLETFDVQNVQDLLILPDGNLLAISGSDLVEVGVADKKIVKKLGGLRRPSRLARDASSGDILVYQEDPTSRQVLRFDSKFRQIASYGREGGRRQGIFHPEDFVAVADIASDNRGGFLVAENQAAPRRIVSFNKDGKVEHQWLGGQMFYHSLGVNPKNPSQVTLNSQFGWLVEWKVDYDKREADVVATWGVNGFLDPLLVRRDFGFWIWVHPITISNQGKPETYYFSELTNGLLLKPDYEGGRLDTVALASVLPNRYSADGLPEHPFKEAVKMAKEKYPALDFATFSFADLNGNLKMDPEEFRFAPGRQSPNFYQGKASTIGPDLSVWEWHDALKPSSYSYNRPIGFTAAGIPIWEPMLLRTEGPPPEGRTTPHVLPYDDGVFTVEYLPGDQFSRWWHQNYWEGHGFGWPATMISGSRLTRRNMDGEILWQTSGHHSGALYSPKGNVDLPWRIAGIAGDFIGLTSQTRQPCEIFTLDGLYVGGLLDGRVDDGLPEYVYKWWRVDQTKGDTAENKGLINYDMGGSGRLAQLPDGRIVFMAAGWNNIPIYQIHGLDKVKKLEGTVKLSSPSKTAAKAGTGLKAEYFTNNRLSGEPALTRIDADVWFGSADKAKANGYKIPWPEPQITSKPFSVRWTGFIEPLVDDNLAIHFYNRSAGVRIWIDGKQVADKWSVSTKKNYKVMTEPVPVKAGQRVPVVIEYRQLRSDPIAHLVWEGLSHPVSHIPTTSLYPPDEKKP